MELETQVYIARDLGYVDDCTGRGLSTKVLEVARILNGLINRFQQEIQGQPSTAARPVTSDL